MENEIEFAKWCLQTHKYVYDTKLNVWFHLKSLKFISWEEIYEIYVKQIKK